MLAGSLPGRPPLDRPLAGLSKDIGELHSEGDHTYWYSYCRLQGSKYSALERFPRSKCSHTRELDRSRSGT